MRINRIILSGFAALLLASCCQGVEMKVGTFNFRNANAADSLAGNGWGQRLPYLAGLVRYEAPEVFGAQEVFYSQLQDFLEAAPEYAYVGEGRDGGTAGEYSPIFYRPESVKLLDSGTFWLSETPDTISRGWDAKYKRICTWAHFKTGCRKFWFFNLHMDHRGDVARLESAKLVLKRLKEMTAGEPAFLTGDFNTNQFDTVYTILSGGGYLIDSYEDAQVRYTPAGSMNHFRQDFYTTERIDHFFHTAGVQPLRLGLRTDIYKVQSESDPSVWETRNISDHYPAFLVCKL